MKVTYGKYILTVVLFWTGCFIVFLLTYLFVLVPQERLKAQTEEQLAEKKNFSSFAQKAAQEQTRFELNEQIDNLDRRLKDFVIQLGDTYNLTFDIDQISNNIKVGSFSQTTTDSEGILPIQGCEYVSKKYIYISFNASFNKFAAFLNALERRQPVIFVETFAITRSRDDSMGHGVDMKLAVLVGREAVAKEIGS